MSKEPGAVQLHGNTSDDPEIGDHKAPFYRMVSAIVADGGDVRPAFSMISQATPDGAWSVWATRDAGLDLAFYRGKLRSAIGYDVGRGDQSSQGYLFFPLADGVFQAALKDVNDVEIIGRHMAGSLGPLFAGMDSWARQEVLRANHVDQFVMPFQAVRADDPAFDGVPDEDLVDMHCFPALESNRPASAKGSGP